LILKTSPDRPFTYVPEDIRLLIQLLVGQANLKNLGRGNLHHLAYDGEEGIPGVA
jgi:hypothetical protein